MGKNPRVSVGKVVHKKKNLWEESVAVSKERRPLQETRQEIVCACPVECRPWRVRGAKFHRMVLRGSAVKKSLGICVSPEASCVLCGVAGVCKAVLNC